MTEQQIRARSLVFSYQTEFGLGIEISKAIAKKQINDLLSYIQYVDPQSISHELLGERDSIREVLQEIENI